MGKKMIYATEEKLAKVNPQNSELVKKFFISKNMNLTESTRLGYESDLNQWLVFIMENFQNRYILDFDIDDAADMIEFFISFCTNTLGNNERRISRRLSSISSVYLYLKKKRKISQSPIELIERPSVRIGEKTQIKQTYLTEDQVEEIRVKLREQKELQLETFFNVGLSTMARVNALVNIKISQIDFENRRIKDVLEKEQKIVTLSLSEGATQNIKDWLEYRKRNNIDSEYLFINTTTKDMGKQISKSTVQSVWIKRIGSLIGIPWLHCHDLRHSSANIAFHRGLSLEAVSKILNHASTQVTQSSYLQIDYDSLYEEKNKFEV